MSDPHDPWKALHARRARHASSRKTKRFTAVPPVATPPKSPRDPRPARVPPERPGVFPTFPKDRKPGQRSAPPQSKPLDFSDPPKAKPSVPRSQGKERFLVSIDMVTEKNREAVRAAARAEGRKLSQWARRILLQAVEH